MKIRINTQIIEEYRKGLACLVPRAEAMSEGTWALTSHEHSLCDCQVLEIFAAHDALVEEFEIATDALLCAEYFIDSVVEDLSFYAEELCLPNTNDVARAKMAHKQIKLALTRLK